MSTCGHGLARSILRRDERASQDAVRVERVDAVSPTLLTPATLPPPPSAFLRATNLRGEAPWNSSSSSCSRCSVSPWNSNATARDATELAPPRRMRESERLEET